MRTAVKAALKVGFRGHGWMSVNRMDIDGWRIGPDAPRRASCRGKMGFVKTTIRAGRDFEAPGVKKVDMWT